MMQSNGRHPRAGAAGGAAHDASHLDRGSTGDGLQPDTPAVLGLAGHVRLLAWGLANGNLQIAMSGDSSVGGNKQWMTSEFSLAQLQTAFNLLLSGFFVAVSAGLCVIRDEELEDPSDSAVQRLDAARVHLGQVPGHHGQHRDRVAGAGRGGIFVFHWPAHRPQR